MFGRSGIFGSVNGGLLAGRHFDASAFWYFGSWNHQAFCRSKEFAGQYNLALRIILHRFRKDRLKCDQERKCEPRNTEPESMSSEPLTLKDAQERVDQWIKEVGVRYFSELTNLAQLVEEVGEMARIISRTYGEQSFKESDTKVSLKDEMADVLFVLICLANQTGVDLTEAFHQNLAKKTKRDATRHLKNEKLTVDSKLSQDKA